MIEGMEHVNKDAVMAVLMRAHFTAAIENDNVSSTMVRTVAAVGKPLGDAFAAALMTLGEVHGPITQARALLFNGDDDLIRTDLERGLKVPGFGNAFFKEGIDPAWHDMDKMVYELDPKTGARLDVVSDMICAAKGKRIYPNAASYTAIAAHWMEFPWHTELALLVMGRLPAWTNQFHEAMYRA
jgi:citrate synthase